MNYDREFKAYIKYKEKGYKGWRHFIYKRLKNNPDEIPYYLMGLVNIGPPITEAQMKEAMDKFPPGQFVSWLENVKIDKNPAVVGLEMQIDYDIKRIRKNLKRYLLKGDPKSRKSKCKNGGKS